MSEVRATTGAGGEPFVPSWKREERDPPGYYFRAVSLVDRELFEAELAGKYRAGRVWPYELSGTLCAAFRAFGGDDVGLLISLVEREQAHAFGHGEPLDAAEQATLDGARKVAVEYWPDYAALVEQMQRREQLLPILAFQHFCTGWDNVPVEYQRDMAKGGVIADAALKKIKPLEMRAAGIAAYNLQYLDEEAEKNSAAPLPSSDSPPTSGSGAVSTEDGKSAPTDGPKTPPSPSPAT